MKQNTAKSSKKNLTKILAVSIFTVGLIPMLYCVIYLGAFWDTYGKINNVPIAFVNLDNPVTKDGKLYDIGKKVEDNLRKDEKVKWSFVSSETGKKGLEGTDYYAMIIIPKDFSQKIAYSQEYKFIKPQIMYISNEGKNYVFSKISQKVADSIRLNVDVSIQSETSKAMVDTLYNVKSSLSEAGNAAKRLNNGVQKLENGSSALLSGAASGVSGTVKLQEGLKDAADGEKKVSEGADALINGLSQFKSSLTQKNDSLNQLVSGSNEVSNGIAALQAGASSANQKLSQGLNSGADGIKQISDYINKANSLVDAAVEDYKTSGSFNKADITNIITAETILTGIKSKDVNKTIAEPMRNSANSLEPLVDNLSKLQTGSKEVSKGTTLLANGIADTQTKAAAGADKLLEGAMKLKDGSDKLLIGIDTAADKTGLLSTGLTKLETGISALHNGIQVLNDGTKKLSNGLYSGSTKISNNLKFTSKEMSDFISDPVELNDKSINVVKYYGDGFAPFFISLSLWIGGVFITLLLKSSKVRNIINETSPKNLLTKFSIGSFIAIIQSIFVSLGLLAILKLDTSHPFIFVLDNIFISLVFFSIMYGISQAKPIFAAPLMFFLFIFQLSASGGTFPIETAPKIYRVIWSFMPMNYSVGSLRMIISGINVNVLIRDLFTLFGFMVIFLALGFIINRLYNHIVTVKSKDDDPAIEAVL